MLILKGVSKSFPGKGTPALDGIDLTIEDGKILGLVGLNGSGKTTTIRVAVGLAHPTEGRIEVDGLDLWRDKARASTRIGWLPELFPFDPTAKAIDLLVYYAGFNGVRRSEARVRACDALEEVGLGGMESRRVRTLSLGMKRRFGLAAVMLTSPQNLLMDEVLNGLDPEGIAFVREWTITQKKQRKAILVSSHMLPELEAIADRIALLHRGRVIQVIEREELRKTAASVLRLTVRNLDSPCLTFLRTVANVREEGDAIVLTDCKLPPEQVNAELVHRGYLVADLRAEGDSLETVFLRRLHNGP